LGQVITTKQDTEQHFNKAGSTSALESIIKTHQPAGGASPTTSLSCCHQEQQAEQGHKGRPFDVVQHDNTIVLNNQAGTLCSPGIVVTRGICLRVEGAHLLSYFQPTLAVAIMFSTYCKVMQWLYNLQAKL
jgi:hypothetical protein